MPEPTDDPSDNDKDLTGMNAKEYKFCEKSIGPGGIKCACCADKHSKKRANRKWRRAAKQLPIG